MNLKTSLQISAIFPVVLAIMVTLGMILRSGEISSARSGLEVAQKVLELVSTLDAETYRVMMSTDAAAFDRWQAESSRVEQFIAAQGGLTGLEAFLLGEIKEAHSALRDGVAKIRTIWEDASSGKAQGAGGGGDLARLQKNIADDMARMRVNAIKMIGRANAGASSAEQFADTIFVVFIGVFAMLMAVNILSASRNAVKRFGLLKTVCENVREGNLTQRLEVREKDEIAEAFKAFNSMIHLLGGRVMKAESELASLKQADADRGSTAAAAREGNMRLADALTKLKRAQGQLVEQERLHALEQIAGGVARDFNASLAPVLTMSDYLVTNPDVLSRPAEVLEDLKLINGSVKKVLKQVRTLADIFQDYEKPQVNRVNVVRAIDAALSLVEPRWQSRPAGRKITLDRRQVPVGDVAGVELDFVEVITVLIDNAAEAMPEGGRLIVETAMDGEFVVVRISDTGEGMSEEAARRCLEPFYSTKGGGHSGMGLTFVVAAVGRCGGTVDIKSQPGNGTAVTLRLNVYDERKHGVQVSGQDSAAGRKLKILVIDDEAWIRSLFAKGLSAEGHSVDTAGTGREGIEKGLSGKHDLVILDRALPDVSGDEVSASLKSDRPAVRIIMVSGLGDMMKESGERPGGVDIILSKPVTITEIKCSISRLFS